jgi:hypothetical protein
MSVGVLQHASPNLVEAGNEYALGVGGAGGEGGLLAAPRGMTGISATTFVLP